MEYRPAGNAGRVSKVRWRCSAVARNDMYRVGGDGVVVGVSAKLASVVCTGIDLVWHWTRLGYSSLGWE